MAVWVGLMGTGDCGFFFGAQNPVRTTTAAGIVAKRICETVNNESERYDSSTGTVFLLLPLSVRIHASSTNCSINEHQ
jgi:hypothetical protein